MEIANCERITHSYGNPTVIINNELHLTGVDDKVARAIRSRLTFINPKWEENEKRGFWNGDTPQELCFLQEQGGILTMPRGFIRQALGILNYHGVAYELDDQRRTLPPVDFHFKGQLRDSRLKRLTPSSPGTSGPWQPQQAQVKPLWAWPW